MYASKEYYLTLPLELDTRKPAQLLQKRYKKLTV